MDPYIQRILNTLGMKDPMSVLETTPQKLEGIFSSFSPTDFARTYAPGKWTVQDILAHLADAELALGFRFRQAVVEDNYRPQAFDQDLWAKRYKRLEPALALETFRALRAWNLALFATFGLDDWIRPVQYPFEGIENVDMMVRFLAGHDLNHIKQLDKIARGND